MVISFCAKGSIPLPGSLLYHFLSIILPHYYSFFIYFYLFSGPGRCKYTGQSVVKLSPPSLYKNQIPTWNPSICLILVQLRQRVLPIRIFTAGKKRSRGVQLVVDECIGKLKQYCSVDDVQIRSNPRNARFGLPF